MYSFSDIEQKWKEKWQKADLYKVDMTDTARPKYYILDMFPYPSGAGLHVGHPKGYIGTDILARYKKMTGHNVLHPMGWDAFGLPAENYAIKMGVHPRTTTDQNILNFKKQLEQFGFCYDWSKEVNTTDADYYRWTQWIFLKLYERGLAYEANMPINWCPSCATGLSNEEVVGGECDRCGTKVERKNLRQWVLRITEYADRLLEDLSGLEWPESIKAMQRNWIGKSLGVNMRMQVLYGHEQKHTEEEVEIFTTRIDTVYGMTFAVLSPEHPLVEKLTTPEQKEAVEAYRKEASRKSDLERTELAKEKTGVFLGSYALNPFNHQKVSLWISDYVLATFGTGIVMGVPAHDERDFVFAEKYGVDIIEVITPMEGDSTLENGAYTEDGILVDSDRFTGLTSAEARVKMSEWLEEKGYGARQVNFKLNDWVFSRQRYWGEPIPLVHCAHCGIVPVPEDQLPLTLPEVESYKPTGTGESPLALITDWVNTSCPKCAGPAKRETNTMPQWAGSCWYYLRYLDPKNIHALADPELLKHWLPVDMYVGGAEHAVLHLLYARFWHKVLYDLGVVTTKEPFHCLKNQGLILAEDGQKMSKSKGNVINPDEIISVHGADVLRVYEMFMGPFDQKVAWDTKGILGIKRFLQRVWTLCQEDMVEGEPLPRALEQIMHKTIGAVTRDIEHFQFNTAISHLMVFSNELVALDRPPKEALRVLVLLLAPFAPFLAEELWETLGNVTFLYTETWPTFDPKLAEKDEIELVLQINGKVRAKLSVPASITEEEAITMALHEERIEKQCAGKQILKTIYVPKKLVNIVIAS